MKNNSFVITRYSEPTHLDTADKGTICQVANNVFYIQMSSDSENPSWIKLESTNLADAQHESRFIFTTGK